MIGWVQWNAGPHWHTVVGLANDRASLALSCAAQRHHLVDAELFLARWQLTRLLHDRRQPEMTPRRAEGPRVSALAPSATA